MNPFGSLYSESGRRLSSWSSSQSLGCGRASGWIFPWSFCRFDHERGEFSPTGGRRPQFFENLVSSRALEHPLVPLLHLVVRRHSTTDDGLLIRRQVHDSNLTYSRLPMLTATRVELTTSCFGGVKRSETNGSASTMPVGQWLGATSEGAVESEYFRLGKIRRAEGIPLSAEPVNDNGTLYGIN